MMFALSTLALAAPPTEGWPKVVVRKESELQTFRADAVQLFEVLDVNDTHAALRVIHSREPDEEMGEGEPVNCKYAGMQKYPTSGVDLVVFPLDNSPPEVFTVYAPALDPNECLDHAASTKALEAAKERMAAVGLDSTKKPAPLADGELKRPWGTAQLSARGETDRDEVMTGSLTWTVKSSGHTLYTSTRNYTLAMAGSAKMNPTKFYATPSGVVALEYTEYFSGRGGTTHTFGFTPMLAIP